MVVSGGTSEIVWAARLGELCGSAGRGPDAERAFLVAWLELARAPAGFLGLLPPHGDPVQVCFGFDEPETDGICCGLFAGPAAAQLARGEPVALRERGPDDDGWPSTSPGLEPCRRLLTVALGEQDKLQAVLVVGWTDDEGGANGLVTATELLLAPLERALLRLTAPRAARHRPAFERSRVPLIFLREDGAVAEVNPAARRKLGVSGPGKPLPGWLGETVSDRIRLMRETGAGLGEITGEHTYLGVTDGRRDFRVGIAPVADEDGGELRWLLTVEKGGPSLWERVEQAEDALGLTPRESLVLELLARGMSNKQIAEVAAVKEATVKFHLFSVMRKSGTANRTELLASFYAGDLSGEEESGGDETRGWTDSVDLGFATLTWDSAGLARFVMAEGATMTRQRAQRIWEEMDARFDSPVRLYADVGGLSALSDDVVDFFGRRSGQRVRACAIRTSGGVGRSAALAYQSEARPPYPLRLFRSEEEALAWLASLD